MRLRRILKVHRIQLPQHLLADNLGQHDVLLHALAHQRDVLVHVSGEVAQPGDPVVIIFHRLKSQIVNFAFNRLDAGIGIRPDQVPLVGLAGDVVFLVVLENVVADLVLRREPVAVDGVKVRQHLVRVPVAARNGF